jgi:hypothetical protein
MDRLAPVLKGRGVSMVDRDGWLRIDAEETARGARVGKPREKLTSRRELLEVALRS